MNRRSLSLFIALLIHPVLFTDGIYAANTGNIQAIAEERLGAKATLDLHYEKGLLDANITNVPLGVVLHDLALRTGARVRFVDPAIAMWSVSLFVTAAPLLQGIKQLLADFSYALYLDATMPTVIICSTHPTITDLRTAGISVTRALPRAEPDKISNRSEEANPAPSNQLFRGQMPQSLDEFQPVIIKEPSSDTQANEEEDADSWAGSAREQEYNEALLRRALEALNSEHKHLHLAAIDQLAELRDSRATEALVEAASTKSSLDSTTRVQATAALGQHASMLRFTDIASINALKQLAEDSHENVRSIARQALQDMESYQTNAQ